MGVVEGYSSTVLAPGEYNVLSNKNAVIAYCRFVIEGSSRGIRADAVYTDRKTGERTLTVPAR
jgi:hypothetical protein